MSRKNETKTDIYSIKMIVISDISSTGYYNYEDLRKLPFGKMNVTIRKFL